MNEITQEQKEQLTTWAEQRDVLLSEISKLRDEKASLEKSVQEVSDSYTQIIADINFSEGRLVELDKKQEEYNKAINLELSKSLENKAVLEAQVEGLEKLIKALTPQKVSLEASISLLTDTFNSVNERVNLLEKVVGHVTQASDSNLKFFEDLMVSFKKNTEDLIALNNSNIEKTNQVIKELPTVFLEVRRKSLIREKI